MMTTQSLTMRDALINQLMQLAHNDRDVLFLSNDFGAPSLDRFRRELPDQYLNVGISEQHFVSAATGMAMAGKKVYIYSIASFVTLRSFEQLKLDVCVHHAPLTFIAVGACYAYSQDGPTHHATEDISIMRSLSGLQILCPSDAASAADFVAFTRGSQHPSYIRLDKGLWPDLKREPLDWRSGLSILRPGTSVGILSTGIMCHRALETAQELSMRGLDCRVIDLWKLKPLDRQALTEATQGLKHLVTLEEHTLHGGLGSILAEFIADFDLPLKLKRIGISDENLYTYGIRQTLHSKLGLDVESLVQTISSWLETH